MDDTRREPAVSRRVVRALAETPNAVEQRLVTWTDRAAEIRQADGLSVKELIGRWGSCERGVFLDCARRLCTGAPADILDSVPAFPPDDGADHRTRELAELLVRFRHVRIQSVEFLEGAAKSDADPAVDWEPLLRRWVECDAQVFARLARFASDAARG